MQNVFYKTNKNMFVVVALHIVFENSQKILLIYLLYVLII